jgi:branched-chain amino acid transport system permease protein
MTAVGTDTAEPLPRRPLPIAVGGRLLALAACAAAPLYLGEYGTQILFRFLVVLVLAEAWNLMAGYTGLVSLGTSSAVGLGGYVLVGIVNHSALPLGLVIVLAAGAGAVLAGAAAPGLLRLRGLYFTVGTLALAEALRLAMINVERFGGATGLFLDREPPGQSELVRIATGLLAATWLVLLVVDRSSISVLLRAVRDDEDVAAQVGVRCRRVKLVVFAVASALMASAGGLQALKLGAIEPYGMFGLRWSIDALSMVVIGGLGQRAGPLVGAAVVIASAELLADYPEAHLALTGVLLIAMMRFAPRGLVGFGTGFRARRRPAPGVAA